MEHSDLISKLEDEITDPEEETFLLYSQPIPSQNLGFIDPKARVLEISVAGRDVVLHQSPTVLSSDRAGGTTGAVFWKLSVLFADWLSSPSNILFTTSSLTPSSSLLELGCGVSPLNALALSPRVASYILTDQPYVQKLLQQNLSENIAPATSSSSRKKAGGSKPAATKGADIRFSPLDWETDQVANVLPQNSAASFDAVVACDCVYNYALIAPFVQTCADACRLRGREEEEEEGEDRGKPSLCIVAQQLRNDDVFQSWLAAFHAVFRVWRVADDLLPEALRSSAGFVVHVGILRDEA